MVSWSRRSYGWPRAAMARRSRSSSSSAFARSGVYAPRSDDTEPSSCGDPRHELLDLRIGVPALGLLLQDQVGPHASAREGLHVVVVRGPVGVRVEVPAPLVPDVLEELHEEERRLRVRRAEPQVLVVASRDLVVQVDVEQLAHRPRLRHVVREVQAGHVLVGDLRVHADHLGVIERRDEREHGTGRREVDVAPRFVRLGLEREAQVIALILDVRAQEVHRVPVPAERHQRVLRGVGLHALAAAPEHVGRRTELHAQIDRPHRLLQRVRADLRVVRRERAVAEHGISEQVRRGHRHHETRRVQRLAEVGDDLIALVRAGVDRHEVVVVEVDAPRADLGEQLDELDG